VYIKYLQTSSLADKVTNKLYTPMDVGGERQARHLNHPPSQDFWKKIKIEKRIEIYQILIPKIKGN
jgi:hypothetical protein